MTGPGVVWTERQRRTLGIGSGKDCDSNEGWTAHRQRDQDPCPDCERARAAYVDSRCGSTAGWMLHRRMRTEPCRGCRDAWNDYQNRHRKKKRRKEVGSMTAREDLLSFADGMHADTVASLRTLVDRLEQEWELDALERIRAAARGLDGLRYRGAVIAARAAFPGRQYAPGLFGNTPQSAACAHGAAFLLRGPNDQANDCQECAGASQDRHTARPVSFENTQTRRLWTRCADCSRSLSWYNHTVRRTA